MKNVACSHSQSLKDISHNLNKTTSQTKKTQVQHPRINVSGLLNMDIKAGKKRPILKKQLKALAQDHPLILQAKQRCFHHDVYLF